MSMKSALGEGEPRPKPIDIDIDSGPFRVEFDNFSDLVEDLPDLGEGSMYVLSIYDPDLSLNASVSVNRTRNSVGQIELGYSAFARFELPDNFAGIGLQDLNDALSTASSDESEIKIVPFDSGWEIGLPGSVHKWRVVAGNHQRKQPTGDGVFNNLSIQLSPSIKSSTKKPLGSLDPYVHDEHLKRNFLEFGQVYLTALASITRLIESHGTQSGPKYAIRPVLPSNQNAYTLNCHYDRPPSIIEKREEKLARVAEELAKLERIKQQQIERQLAEEQAQREAIQKARKRIKNPEDHEYTAPRNNEPVPAVVQQMEPRFSLADVVGLKDVKQEVQDIIDAFSYPSIVKSWGGAPPKAILLHGLPGNGKTMLAHAIAYAADANLWVVSSEDIYDMYLGESTKNMANLFKALRARTEPVVVLFDEIEGVLGRTSIDTGGGATQARNEVASTFRTQLDSLTNRNVLVVGTTNRIQAIEPSTIRNQRFNYRIYVPPLDTEGRKALIAQKIDQMASNSGDGPPRFANDVDIESLAHSSNGLSGADITTIFEKIAVRKSLEEIRSDLQPVTQADLLETLSLIVQNHTLITSEEP